MTNPTLLTVEQITFFSGGRSNTDGDLALTGDGELCKLTRLVNKLVLVLRFLKNQLEGFQVAVFSFDSY